MLFREVSASEPSSRFCGASWCLASSRPRYRWPPPTNSRTLPHLCRTISSTVRNPEEGTSRLSRNTGCVPRYSLRTYSWRTCREKSTESGELEPNGGRKLTKLFELLGDAYASSVLGEFLDLEMVEKSDASESDYEHMIGLKTGALIGASSASGVVVGSMVESDHMVDVAYRFGELLGMAYQVQDDLLDIVGDEGVLGKPVFADIKGGKKNLVLIHTAQLCSQEDREFLAGIPANGGRSLAETEIERARALFVKFGSIDYARKVATGYVERARSMLDNLEPREARGKLAELCGYLTDRKY